METDEFLRATKKLMDDAERAKLVGYLACYPTAGDLIPGTGGVARFVGGSKDAASVEEHG